MRRSIPLASAGLLALLAACGGNSTAPTPPPPILTAQFLDSVYGHFVGLGTHADSATATLVATLIELGPAYGGQEASFLVTTASGTQTWYGYTYELADTAGDSAFYTAAFSDSLLTNVMLIAQEFGADSSAPAAELLQDTFATTFEDSAITAYALQSAVGESCSLQSGLQAASVLTAFTGSALCNYATLGVGARIAFPAADNLGALQTWAIAEPGFVGPRLVLDGPAPTRVSVPPSRFAAALARLRTLFTNSSRRTRRAL